MRVTLAPSIDWLRKKVETKKMRYVPKFGKFWRSETAHQRYVNEGCKTNQSDYVLLLMFFVEV